MKKETKRKLDELVELIVNDKINWNRRKFSELSECDNFLSIMKRWSEDKGLIFHKLTIEKWSEYLVAKVLDAYDNDLVVEMPESINFSKVMKLKLPGNGGVDELEIEWDGGIKRYKIVEVEIEQPKIEKPIRNWSGLFNYINDDKVIIRLGKYRGCNIKSANSLKEHFRDVLDLYGFILDCLHPETIKKVKGSRSAEELEMNIKTLEEMKDKILKSRAAEKFPTCFKK